MADPGFFVGGAAPTSDVAIFHKICMPKRKNRNPGAPLDPPMVILCIGHKHIRDFSCSVVKLIKAVVVKYVRNVGNGIMA